MPRDKSQSSRVALQQMQEIKSKITQINAKIQKLRNPDYLNGLDSQKQQAVPDLLEKLGKEKKDLIKQHSALANADAPAVAAPAATAPDWNNTEAAIQQLEKEIAQNQADDDKLIKYLADGKAREQPFKDTVPHRESPLSEEDERILEELELEQELPKTLNPPADTSKPTAPADTHKSEDQIRYIQALKDGIAQLEAMTEHFTTGEARNHHKEIITAKKEELAKLNSPDAKDAYDRGNAANNSKTDENTDEEPRQEGP